MLHRASFPWFRGNHPIFFFSPWFPKYFLQKTISLTISAATMLFKIEGYFYHPVGVHSPIHTLNCPQTYWLSCSKKLHWHQRGVIVPFGLRILLSKVRIMNESAAAMMIDPVYPLYIWGNLPGHHFTWLSFVTLLAMTRNVHKTRKREGV